MKPSRKIPPTDASHSHDSFPSIPEKAAEVPGAPTGSVIRLSRSDKRETMGCVFTCICGEGVHGIMLFENGIPTKIKCCNCGSSHEAKKHKIVTANFGNDCTHRVRTYDCKNREYTCHDCHTVVPGTLKIRTSGTNLPDGDSAFGDQVGSRPPISVPGFEIAGESDSIVAPIHPDGLGFD